MKSRNRYIVVTILLTLIFAVGSACSTKMLSTNLVPDFSQDRMMETIAIMSSEDGGRIAGFEGEAKTADYIKNRFEDIDLAVSMQSFPIKAFSCKNVSVSDTESGNKIQDVRVLTFSAPTPARGLIAEVIPVGMGAASDYSEIDVAGKIALIMRGGEYFRIKTQRAADNGAIAVVFYDPNGEEAIAATLTQLSEIPAVSISRKEAEALESSISSGSKIELELLVESLYRDSESSNVIGIYESSNNPDGEFVIVGAHYDGVDTPAANDNASGIAVMIEIATVLSEQNIALPYDIKFIAFGAEEIGLLGSTAYVEAMSRTELDSVVAMVNFDMVGAGEFIELFTADGTDATQLQKSMKNVLNSMGFTPKFSKTERSDHTPFSYSGIQAVDVQTSPALYYHTDYDNIDIIQPDLLKKVCEFGARLLTEELTQWVD